MKKRPGSAVEDIADYVARSACGDLASDLVDATKRCFLDWVAAALAGSKEPAAASLLSVLKGFGGNEQSTVIGSQTRTSALNAALINGTMSHVLDYDDLYYPGVIHPSVTLFPAIVAIAERDKVSGMDLINSFVTGYEVETRVAEVCGKPLLQGRWQTTACVGPFGAAVGVGKLIHLDRAQLKNALGIAATKSAGLIGAFGTMSKALQVGAASANGLMAALLAQNDFTGPEDALAGENGFVRVYAKTSLPESQFYDLGDTYRLLKNSFKIHASCGGTHAAIDAALEIRKRFSNAPGDVTGITCEVGPNVPIVCGNPNPSSGVQGKFSLQYCVSVALIEGEAGEAQFTDEKVHDDRCNALTRKVRLLVNPEFDARHAVVTVATAQGEYKRKIDCMKGHCENPLIWDELVAKFRRLTNGVLPEASVNSIVRSVEGLEELDDLEDVMALTRCQDIRGIRRGDSHHHSRHLAPGT